MANTKAAPKAATPEETAEIQKESASPQQLAAAQPLQPLPLNLYQKLAKIRKSVEVLEKDKDGYNYRYVTDALILSKITGLMDSLHVSLIPSVKPGTMTVTPYAYSKTKVNKRTGEVYEEKSAEILTQAEMLYSWINDDNPAERIEIPWVMVGQQEDASQSFGSGLTYTYRYFLLKYFGISTVEDDPDNWRSRQREAAEAEGKEASAKIIGEVDTLVKQYLAEHTDQREEIVKFLSRYVKGGNYTKITEPVMATKLLNDFKAAYMPEKTEEKE